MATVMKYVAAGKVSDYFPRMGRVVVIDNREIAVFRTSEDEFYALDNRSPHPKGGPLAEGIVSGQTVYDPLYDWKIDLKTGNVQAPDHGRVLTYPVSIKGQGEVSIGLCCE